MGIMTRFRETRKALATKRPCRVLATTSGGPATENPYTCHICCAVGILRSILGVLRAALPTSEAALAPRIRHNAPRWPGNPLPRVPGRDLFGS